MGCNKSCLNGNENVKHVKADKNFDLFSFERYGENELYKENIPTAVPVLTCQSVQSIVESNSTEMQEEQEEQKEQVFNKENLHRWRGFEDLQAYILSDTKYDGMMLSHNVIRHAYHDIDIYLRYFKRIESVSVYDRKIQFEVSWNIVKRFEKDIQRLCINMDCKTKTSYILLCTTLQDLKDLVNCLKRFIPEMSTIEDILFYFLKDY